VTLNQALLNMHFAVANGKGVQLDAEQTAAVLALIESQSQSLDRLSQEIDMLRQANITAPTLTKVIHDLCAEVERFRAEADEMRRWAEEAAHAENLNALDAQKERAAVVAWLREPGEYVDPACERLADCIERGVHRKETT
jgi:hypothetical protein